MGLFRKSAAAKERAIARKRRKAERKMLKAEKKAMNGNSRAALRKIEAAKRKLAKADQVEKNLAAGQLRAANLIASLGVAAPAETLNFGSDDDSDFY